MKILVLSPLFYPAIGGIECCIANLCQHYQAAGHDVTLFTSRPVREIAERLPYRVLTYAPATYRAFNANPRLGRRYLELQMRPLIREGYDIWHVFILYPFGWALSRTIHKHRIPAIVSARGSDIQCDPAINYGMRLDPQLEPLIRQAANAYPLVTCLTESVRQDLHDLDVTDDHIRIIPNGVDFSRLQAGPPKHELRRQLGLPADAPILISVGRNHPKKNYPGLLKTIAILRHDFPDIRCCIVGKDTSKLAPLADQLGIADAMILVEHIDPSAGALFEAPAQQLVNYYRAADCFVMPTFTETFGIVLIEAMAADLPVIATRAPGCIDVVREDDTGLMVPIDDAQAMADAVRRVLTDEALRSSLVTAGRQQAEAYAWPNIANQYLDAYQHVLPT